jgi:hypothetical protein
LAGFPVARRILVVLLECREAVIGGVFGRSKQYYRDTTT